MTKKSLPQASFAAKILFSAALAALCVSCGDDGGTSSGDRATIVLGELPPLVKYVLIEGKRNSTDLLTSAGSYETTNLGSVGRLTVRYLDETELARDELGFGNLESDTGALKVFVDGEELANETELFPSDLGYEVPTNARVTHYTATIPIAGETVEIGFAGAPRRIKTSEVRLADETGVAYVDLSGVAEGVDALLYEDEAGFPEAKYVVWGGLRYAAAGSKVYLAAGRNPGWRLTSTDFEADGKAIPQKDWGEDFNNVSSSDFSGEIVLPAKAGSVVKVTGGAATEISSAAIKGKTFSASKAKEYIPVDGSSGDADEQVVDLAIEISFKADKTFSLTWDGEKYSGTYTMVDEENAQLQLNPGLDGSFAPTPGYGWWQIFKDGAGWSLLTNLVNGGWNMDENGGYPPVYKFALTAKS